VADFRQLEPGNWQFDLGDEYFTPSRTSVDPAIPLLPLETAAAGGSFVGEGDGDSWFGAHLATLGVVAAGAALALSTSVSIAGGFNKQDERPAAAAATPAAATSTAGFAQRKVETTVFHRWAVQDDAPYTAPPANALDDDAWQPFSYNPPPITLLAQPQDDHPAWRIDEVYAWTAYTVAPITVAQPFSDNDEIIPQPAATPAGASSTGWGPKRATQETVFHRWAAQDELPTPAAPTTIDEGDTWAAWPKVEALQLPPPAAPFAAQDDLPAPAAVPDEAYWIQPPFPWPAPLFAVFDDGFIEPPLVDETYPWTAPFTVPWAIAAQPFQSNDEIVPHAAGSIPFDEQPWQTFWSVNVAPVVTVFDAQDERVAQPTASAGGGVISYEKGAPTIVRWHQPDELPTAGAATLADEGAPWVPPSAAAPPPVVTVFDAQDERPTPSTFVPPDDEGPVLLRSLDEATSTVWATDEVIVPQGTAAPDDSYPWTAPFTVPWAIAAQPAQTNDEIAQQPAPAVGGGPIVYERGAPIFQRWYQPDERPEPVAGTPLPFDEETWGDPRAFIVAPIVTVFAAQDERPTPATFTPIEDDGPPLLRSLDEATSTVWATDEVIVPQSAPDDTYPWTAPFTVPWGAAAQPMRENDEIATPAPTFPPDEGEWQPYRIDPRTTHALPWHDEASVAQHACTLSPQHAAWLEALARAHGLIDPLSVDDPEVVPGALRTDGTLVQTVTSLAGTVTLTTTAGPTGAAGGSALTAQQAQWLEALVRVHGLIDPLVVTSAARGDGTLAQTMVNAAGTTVVTRTA